MNRGRYPKPATQCRCLLASALLAFGSSAWASTAIRVSGADLSPAETRATEELVGAAFARLPRKWRDGLDTRIELVWRNDLPAEVHGRARGWRLSMDRSLLPGWMEASRRLSDAAGRGDRIAGPGRAALATLIHELAHYYDRTPQGHLSKDPRLLDLAGWQVSPLRLGLRNPRNAFSDRSPDLYELTDPVEFVAVNLEHFLLDPEYACRRPGLHRYFSEHFGIAPASADCAPGTVFVQASVEASESLLLQIDPERVYGIDYLLAEPDERIMSRWGHGMLRLVVCAPGRPRGPDCRLDLLHHRVLSFRAFVDDVQISSWRGLTGSYPSRLFVLPLDQVIEEYTRIELRGLQSVPLRLERTEITELLERAARLHWSYDGRYYFLSNNCAVETFKLLHDGIPRLADERLASITPTGLLKRLRRAGIADTRVLDDPEEAKRLGYRFEAMNAHYQAVFAVARDSLELPQREVRDWLNASPGKRARFLDMADLRASAALLLLEQAALRREELHARDDLKRLLPKMRRPGSAGPGAAHRQAEPPAPDPGMATDPSTVEGALAAALELEALLGRPAALLSGEGYGLPQREERALLERTTADHAVRWRQLHLDLRGAARDWLPASRRAALEDIEANLDTLGRRLRQLHRASGGFQLPERAD